jgi:hypothetical protein
MSNTCVSTFNYVFLKTDWNWRICLQFSVWFRINVMLNLTQEFVFTIKSNRSEIK